MPRATRRSRTVNADVDVKSTKCKCNPTWMVVGWILGAFGIWALVAGFATQFTSAAPASVNYNVLGWYFAGLLLVGLAKISKWKSCGACGVHYHK